MHHNAIGTNNQGPEVNSNNSYTVSSQPWWHGIGHDGVSRDMLGESMADISLSREPINNGLATKASKSLVKGGMDGGTDANKEMLNTALPQAGTCLQFLSTGIIVNSFVRL